MPGLLGVGMRNQAGPSTVATYTRDATRQRRLGRERLMRARAAVLEGDDRVFAFGNAEWGQCGGARPPKRTTSPATSPDMRLRRVAPRQGSHHAALDLRQAQDGLLEHRHTL